MKTIPVALKASSETLNTTFAVAMKITRLDGLVLAVTSHDKDDPISGVIYKANPGLLVTNLVMQSGTQVGNLELTTVHDGTVFLTIDIVGGLWRGAVFTIFRYDYQAISSGIDTLLAGTVGEVEIRQGTVVAELRDWRQYLQQNVGDASSRTCRARLGDARCRKDLTSFTKSGTITAVTSQHVFADTGVLQADDYFGEGQITWITGDNAGITNKIAEYTSAGQFTLALPTPAAIQIGDTYTAIAGCRKRQVEDCTTKFNNILNMVAEPHRMGLNNLTASPSDTPVGTVLNAQPFVPGSDIGVASVATPGGGGD